MSNLRENYLINEKFCSSSFTKRQHHDLDALDRSALSRSSKMLQNCDKSSLKNIKINHKLFDKPVCSGKLRNSDHLLSKSAYNLNSNQSINDNCPKNGLNNLNDGFYNVQNNCRTNNDISINNLVTRLLQMEQQMNCQSAKLFSFEKKIEDLNKENDELTQALLANRLSTREANEATIKNYPIISLKEELITTKERLNSQILQTSKLEKENAKLADKYQQSQVKLNEFEEKYETLIAMKNRELDDQKLKIEHLTIELNAKEEELNQLELDKQHLRNKVSMLNQVTDKQDEKIEQHNSQLDRFDQEIENLKKQINCKEVENEKLRKELILIKNSLKKMQNLNQTNENLIIWLNKQLTDSQSKFNLLYPKPKKSTSINLNQRAPVDCESLSEALSDSHIFGPNYRLNQLDDYRNDDYCRKEFIKSDFKNEFQNDYKSEFKNDHRIKKQLKSGTCQLRSNLDRRLDCSNYSNRATELKSNYLASNVLYTNKRLKDVESFKCTIEN